MDPVAADSNPPELAAAVARAWPADSPLARRFVVCTGGEPSLRLDPPLIAALHSRSFEVAVETNGTLPAPDGVNWLFVSPKLGSELVQRSGDELKLVYPQIGSDPADFELLSFRHFFDSPRITASISTAYNSSRPTPNRSGPGGLPLASWRSSGTTWP